MKKLLSAGVLRDNTLDKAAQILASSPDTALLFKFISLFAKHKSVYVERASQDSLKKMKGYDKLLKRMIV